jgi:hypothetical protein
MRVVLRARSILSERKPLNGEPAIYPMFNTRRIFPAAMGDMHSMVIRKGPAHRAWTAVVVPYRKNVAPEISQ